ncbi:DAPK1 [Branchiostoma lanceolatum]|uniref:DAPK1 protein n=1 Tax=Branchiostoma lanceolatum TaxID=7740 RepID=A0A8K0ELY4_BRALA|nr:DAPK1 [Branchiostoma lanceolatum]
MQHHISTFARTAVHVASVNGNSEMVELLIQNGADVNSKDKLGWTALHLASGNTEVGKLLIQRGANVEARDKDGKTALHRASISTEMVESLIQNGADVEARDKYGNTALHSAISNGKTEIVEMLIQHGADVQAKDKARHTPLDSVHDQDRRRYLKNLAKEVPYHKLMKQSGGVKVDRFKLCICGPQEAGKSTLKESLQTVHWWLCFIKSCNTKSKPNVILVASHADQTETGHGKASSILELMTSEFNDHLNISDEVFLLDCRKTRQTDMRGLKHLLTSLKTQLLAHQRAIPKLCAEIIKCLPKWAKERCSPKCPVLSWAEYKEAVMEVDRLANEDFVKTTSQYLDHLGEILFVSSTAEPIVILTPNWLCTDVFGKVMAPDNFPIHLRTSEDIVTKKEIKKVFQEVADVDLLITLLQEFQLCHSFDGQEFIFPGLLTQTMPPGKWQPTADPTKTVYFGKQVQCGDTTDMFSSGFFPRVQTRLMRQLKNRPLLWRDGAKCFDFNVESLIKLSPDGRAVNICVRSEQGDKLVSRQMLEKLENILNNVLYECSPGTTTVERVLSARALREHREEFYSYSMEQIDKAKAEDRIVYHDILGFSEDIDDLLYGGRDDNEDEQGAVGNQVPYTFVYGVGNIVINAAEGSHFDMQSIAQRVGQLQLEGNEHGDLGQLEMEENVAEDEMLSLE